MDFSVAITAEYNKVFQFIIRSIFIFMMNFKNIYVFSITTSNTSRPIMAKRTNAIYWNTSVIVWWMNFFHSIILLGNFFTCTTTEMQPTFAVCVMRNPTIKRFSTLCADKVRIFEFVIS